MLKLAVFLFFVFIHSYAQFPVITESQHHACSGPELYSKNEHDMRMFGMCIDHELYSMICPDGLVYIGNGKCAILQFPTVEPIFEKCAPGKKLLDIFQRSCYSECGEDGVFQMGKCCGPDKFFDSNTEKCSFIAVTTPALPVDSSSESPSSFKPHPYFCANYYKCADGKCELKECEKGTVWDQSTQECSKDSSHCGIIRDNLNVSLSAF
ncbi:unnamed protein product [Caenorhabditis nigoni]